jgi:hypothetical protein
LFVNEFGWHALSYSEGRAIQPLTVPTPFGVPQGVAALLWTLWKNGEPYDPRRVRHIRPAASPAVRCVIDRPGVMIARLADRHGP